jgi:hypothetical protein
MDSKTLDRCFTIAINNYKLELDSALQKFTKEKDYLLEYINLFHKTFLKTIVEKNKYEDDLNWGNSDRGDYRVFQHANQLHAMLVSLYPNSTFQFHKVPQYDSCDYNLIYKLNPSDINQLDVMELSEELKEKKRKRQLIVDEIIKKQKEIEILKATI